MITVHSITETSFSYIRNNIKLNYFHFYRAHHMYSTCTEITSSNMLKLYSIIKFSCFVFCLIKNQSLSKSINGIPQNKTQTTNWTGLRILSHGIFALALHLNILVLPRSPLNLSCSIFQIETMKNYSKELHIII